MARSSGIRLYAVVCPHCGKEFEAELLSGGSDRHRGFKCPHCRLFIADDRVDKQPSEDEDGSG